jgi:hypothetical protein
MYIIVVIISLYPQFQILSIGKLRIRKTNIEFYL